MILIDGQLRQMYTCHIFIHIENALCQWEVRFCRWIELEPLGVPWVDICCVQVEELICLIKCLHLADGAFHHIGT